ncbi:MAG: hypothetical protein NC191_04035 [Muribaculaceae bacterium]|nr:hypothetical protein [Muribaculaceae bacterium]
MVSNLLNYTKRTVKLVPDFVLGTSAETMGAAMRNTPGSLFTKVRAGGRALEAEVAANSALHGGFFKRTFKGLASTPRDIARAATEGIKAAKMAGKSTLVGGAKGALKGVGKKLPVVGAVLTIALEAPNIFRAFKEGGLITGLKEIAGAAVELGTMAAGAAIGSAICPGIGTVIGGLVGGVAGMFIRGKTHSDKQDEIDAVKKQLREKCGLSDEEIKDIQEHEFDEKYIEQVLKEKADNQLREAGLTDEQIKKIAKNGYNEEEISATIEKNCVDQLKAAGLSDEQIKQIAEKGYNEEDIEAVICENYNNELKAAGLTEAQISEISVKGYKEADIQKAIDENNRIIARLQQAGVPYAQIQMIANNGFNESEIASAIEQAQQCQNMYTFNNPYGFGSIYPQFNTTEIFSNPYSQDDIYDNQYFYSNPYVQQTGYGQINPQFFNAYAF